VLCIIKGIQYNIINNETYIWIYLFILTVTFLILQWCKNKHTLSIKKKIALTFVYSTIATCIIVFIKLFIPMQYLSKALVPLTILYFLNILIWEHYCDFNIPDIIYIIYYRLHNITT
jgi:hypothetical protein